MYCSKGSFLYASFVTEGVGRVASLKKHTTEMRKSLSFSFHDLSPVLQGSGDTNKHIDGICTRACACTSTNYIWSRGYKTFFMLNSDENKISNAHNY